MYLMPELITGAVLIVALTLFLVFAPIEDVTV